MGIARLSCNSYNKLPITLDPIDLSVFIPCRILAIAKQPKNVSLIYYFDESIPSLDTLCFAVSFKCREGTLCSLDLT